jgi:hypothetical protein
MRTAKDRLTSRRSIGEVIRAGVERWEGSPLVRAGKEEHDEVDSTAAIELVTSMEGDECSMASFEDPEAGSFLHVSCAAGRYAINARGADEAYFFRVRDCTDGRRERVWIAGFEWELHCRFVLDRAAAEEAVSELFGPGGLSPGNGHWEAASPGPDARPLGALAT